MYILAKRQRTVNRFREETPEIFLINSPEGNKTVFVKRKVFDEGNYSKLLKIFYNKVFFGTETKMNSEEELKGKEEEEGDWNNYRLFSDGATLINCRSVLNSRTEDLQFFPKNHFANIRKGEKKRKEKEREEDIEQMKKFKQCRIYFIDLERNLKRSFFNLDCLDNIDGNERPYEALERSICEYQNLSDEKKHFFLFMKKGNIVFFPLPRK